MKNIKIFVFIILVISCYVYLIHRHISYKEQAKINYNKTDSVQVDSTKKDINLIDFIMYGYPRQ